LPDGTVCDDPTRRQAERATLAAKTMAILAPPGRTWDAKGNEEALIRTPDGLARYSERGFKVSKPKPKPKPKKQHKKFTSTAPDIGDEGVEAYQEKLKSLLDDARALLAPPQPEVQPETDGVQEYEDALEALVDTDPSEPAQVPMASPPRPEDGKERQETPEPPHSSVSPPPLSERRQERQDTPEPGEPPSDDEHIWEWKHLMKRYHAYRGGRPTTRELARVNVVPKRPSPLSQVQNANSDISTTPSSSPPHSPRPLPKLFTAANGLFTPDAILHCMEILNKRSAHPWPLPRAGTPGLMLFHRALPEPEPKPEPKPEPEPEPAAAAAQPDVKLLNWKVSNQMRDLSFLLKSNGSPSVPR
jgi:hypothetical protein